MIKYVKGNKVVSVSVEICKDGMGIHYWDNNYTQMIEYYSYPIGFCHQAYKMAKKLETDNYQVADYTNLPLMTIKDIDKVSMK